MTFRTIPIIICKEPIIFNFTIPKIHVLNRKIARETLNFVDLENKFLAPKIHI